MTDIVKVDELRDSLEAKYGVTLNDAQALAIYQYFCGPTPAPSGGAAGDQALDADRFAVARRTGLITDADLEDIDAELAHQSGGVPPA